MSAPLFFCFVTGVIWLAIGAAVVQLFAPADPHERARDEPPE